MYIVSVYSTRMDWNEICSVLKFTRVESVVRGLWNRGKVPRRWSGDFVWRLGGGGPIMLFCVPTHLFIYIYIYTCTTRSSSSCCFTFRPRDLSTSSDETRTAVNGHDDGNDNNNEVGFWGEKKINTPPVEKGRFEGFRQSSVLPYTYARSGNRWDVFENKTMSHAHIYMTYILNV